MMLSLLELQLALGLVLGRFWWGANSVLAAAVMSSVHYTCKVKKFLMSVPDYEGNLNLLLNIPAQQFKTFRISYSTHFPVTVSVSSTTGNSLTTVHLAKL